MPPLIKRYIQEKIRNSESNNKQVNESATQISQTADEDLEQDLKDTIYDYHVERYGKDTVRTLKKFDRDLIDRAKEEQGKGLGRGQNRKSYRKIAKSSERFGLPDSEVHTKLGGKKKA